MVRVWHLRSIFLKYLSFNRCRNSRAILYLSVKTIIVPVFWWMRLDLVFLVGRTASGDVFWGICELIMILGSLSANGWGCVPVLVVVWHSVSSSGACWLLSGAGS